MIRGLMGLQREALAIILGAMPRRYFTCPHCGKTLARNPTIRPHTMIRMRRCQFGASFSPGQGAAKQRCFVYLGDARRRN